MKINKLYLDNFRNYDKQEIEFSKNNNIIYGKNAQGKTNIIEAIYICSYGKSFRSKKDKDIIRFGENSAIIEVFYDKKDRDGNIKAIIDDNKTFLINGIKQSKISEVVGKINIIIFTPDDIEIIKDGPEKRRRFIDMTISSLRPNYIHLLNSYNKALEQRNSFLKQIKIENNNIDMLDVWDDQLSKLSTDIYEYRNKYVEKYKNIIEDIHKKITKSGNEIIKIKYISNGKTKESFLENLKKTREIDINRGYTSTGIHRDDLIIYINGKPVSVFGSQGQQRTAVLTLKLCEAEIVEEETGEKPVLLLDDFMSELDEERRCSILDNFKDNQVIITCTDKIETGEDTRYFYIENGICTSK